MRAVNVGGMVVENIWRSVSMDTMVFTKFQDLNFLLHIFFSTHFPLTWAVFELLMKTRLYRNWFNLLASYILVSHFCNMLSFIVPPLGLCHLCHYKSLYSLNLLLRNHLSLSFRWYIPLLTLFIDIKNSGLVLLIGLSIHGTQLNNWKTSLTQKNASIFLFPPPNLASQRPSLQVSAD